jgi:hypothetical protein
MSKQLDKHESVQRLLPWMLSGTLDSDDLELIQPHLASCQECQAELDWQREIIAAAPAPDPALDPERAFAALLPRLGPQEARVGVLERWREALAANSAWLRWTALAQLATIGVLAAMLARPAPDPGYRALGAAPHAGGDAVIMFKPDTTESEMRRILQASGARVVDGPTVTDAYVLALPPGQAAGALARQRAEQAVSLARPLGVEASP